MKYLAAYLLLAQGGVEAPTKDQITSLLSSVGVDSDDSRIETLLSELQGKSIDELIAEGNTKLASVPTGGAAAGSSSGAAASGAAGAAEEEEAKEESAAEESDADMGFGLFD